MLDRNIRLSHGKLAEFCRMHHIRRLRFFGSVLRDDFGPMSDIDVLVDFEPGQVPSLMGMAALEAALSEMLGRQVDLRTAAELSRHFRDNVLREAETAYVAAG